MGDDVKNLIMADGILVVYLIYQSIGPNIPEDSKTAVRTSNVAK
jgi:hypothetical protein